MRAAPWLAFCVAYLAAWFVSTAIPVPLLWHLPVERRFTFVVHPLGLGADFYGRLLLCLGAGAVAFVLARAALPKLRPGLIPLLLVWTCGLLLFTGGLYVYTLASRQPIPAPLPAGYVPR